MTMITSLFINLPLKLSNLIIQMSDMPPTATPDDSSQVKVEVLTNLEEKTETTESDSAPAIVPVKL